MAIRDLLPTASELRMLSKSALVDYASRCVFMVKALRSAELRESRGPERLEAVFRDFPDASDESLEQMLKKETASSMANNALSLFSEAAIYAFAADPFHAHLIGIEPEDSLTLTLSAARAAASCALAATGLAAKRTASDSEWDISDPRNVTRAETACNIAMQDFIAKVQAEYQLLLARTLAEGAGGGIFVN